MKILIIGGSDLISTAITRLLVERGSDTLTLYNRGQTALRFDRSVNAIIQCRGKKGFTLILPTQQKPIFTPQSVFGWDQS